MLIEREGSCQQPASDYCNQFFAAQELNYRQFAMGCIQLNEKLVARLKIGQFETKAVGFCEHATHVVVKFFIKFFTAREST